MGLLINSLGSGLVFPFMSLYLNGKLNFSMTEVGTIFALYSATSIISQLVGGSLVDRIGRKPIMLFSLYGVAVGTTVLGLSSSLIGSSGLARIVMVGVVVLLLGLTGAAFNPAVNAMVADLVESHQRTQAYGLIRIVTNLGVAIGPAIGGVIASRSYLLLFMLSAVASVVYGVIITLFVRETRPTLPNASKATSTSTSQKTGMGAIFSDRIFLTFNMLYLCSTMVYAQMNTTLPVYLKQGFGVSESWYGLLMSLNAAMVVLFQFPLTHWLSRYARGKMMALGMLLFAVGFGMFGFVSVLPLFFLAQAIWTTGEMVASPVAQAFVADAAPVERRGIYMGFYGLMWGVGYGLGPLFGGLVMDQGNGRVIWYAAIGINLAVMLGFLIFNRRMQARLENLEKQIVAKAAIVE